MLRDNKHHRQHNSDGWWITPNNGFLKLSMVNQCRLGKKKKHVFCTNSIYPWIDVNENLDFFGNFRINPDISLIRNQCATQFIYVREGTNEGLIHKPVISSPSWANTFRCMCRSVGEIITSTLHSLPLLILHQPLFLLHRVCVSLCARTRGWHHAPLQWVPL